MYQIAPAHMGIIRAWQGHQKEQKWFYCLQGAFLIQTVQVSDFKDPDPSAAVAQHQLLEHEPGVLHLPGGHASGIQATVPESKLLVFSDVSLQDSKDDDYRFKIDLWQTEWMV